VAFTENITTAELTLIPSAEPVVNVQEASVGVEFGAAVNVVAEPNPVVAANVTLVEDTERACPVCENPEVEVAPEDTPCVAPEAKSNSIVPDA
jgi:hypothetical protein